MTAKSKEIDELFRGGPVLTDTRSKGVFQAKSLGDLSQLISLAHYLGYACVGLVLALVATTTVMSVQDRIKEHAVLQTLGVTGRRVFGLVLSESTLLSIAGGLVGVAAAMLALQLSHLSVGAEAVTIAFQPSWPLAATGIFVSAVVGLLAGLAPGWHAARTNIVNAPARLKYARSLPLELVLLNDQGVPMEIVASPLLFCEIVPDAVNE